MLMTTYFNLEMFLVLPSRCFRSDASCLNKDVETSITATKLQDVHRNFDDNTVVEKSTSSDCTCDRSDYMSLVGRKSPSIPLPLVNNYFGSVIHVPLSHPTYLNLVSSAIPRPFQTTGFASNPPQLSSALAHQVSSGRDVNHHDNIGRRGPSCGGNVSGVQNHGHRGGVPNTGISRRDYDGQGRDFNAVTCGRNSAFDPRNNLVQNRSVVNDTHQWKHCIH